MLNITLLKKKWRKNGQIEKSCKDEKVQNPISPISGAALVDTWTLILGI